MATSTLNFAAKTVNNRLVRTAVTFAAGDDDYTSDIFTVPVGRLLTLVATCITTLGSAGTNVKLQGSVDGVNFATVKQIDIKASTGDIIAAGASLAKVFNPATEGDFPYYRLSIDNNATNASAGRCWILET